MNNRDLSSPRSPGAPLLSILIPTKDRYDTLVPVVEQIAGRISDPRLEIVVCDNSAVLNEARVARLTADTRVSYHYSDADWSVVGNTEAGIALCRGEYVCFIGDDDLVSPHIVRIADWLKREEADCLIYPPARYWWSSVQFAKQSRYQRPGVLWMPKDRRGDITIFDAAEQLDLVLARGGVSYMNLPRLYHGIVSRPALQRIHDVFGRYVPGSSPDIALSTALALTNKRYLSIDYPVTIFGASRGSGGGRTAARKHHGHIKDQKHLPAGILNGWDPLLPRIWSEQIIYAQTIHEVFLNTHTQSGLSYPALYGSLLAYEPHIFKYLWPILTEYTRKNPISIPKILVQTALKVAGRLRMGVRLATGFGMPFDLRNFEDIGELMNFMAQMPPPDMVETGNGVDPGPRLILGGQPC